jgi:hypothetical protein
MDQLNAELPRTAEARRSSCYCCSIAVEEKRQHDPFLVWDGSFRWFRSEKVVPLERYRTSEEIDRIRSNVLRRLQRI